MGSCCQNYKMFHKGETSDLATKQPRTSPVFAAITAALKKLGIIKIKLKDLN